MHLVSFFLLFSLFSRISFMNCLISFRGSDLEMDVCNLRWVVPSMNFFSFTSLLFFYGAQVFCLVYDRLFDQWTFFISLSLFLFSIDTHWKSFQQRALFSSSRWCKHSTLEKSTSRRFIELIDVVFNDQID